MKNVYFLVLLVTLTFGYPSSGFSGEMSYKKNIVQVAEQAGSFNTLVSLLKSSGLDQTLSADGPFTVFAPTDKAFSMVPEKTLQELQRDPDKLKKVLTYHVVSGKVPASKVATLNSAKTVQGSSVSIDTSEGVKINTATVTSTDIMASNGVIHVIDSVLMPKS